MGRMKLGLFLAGYGHHLASWRHPKSVEQGPVDIDHIVNISKIAERGKFDLVFLSDALYIDETAHPDLMSRLDPFTLMTIIARETSDIGLAATVSTTYSQPFHLARAFSSLDHVSGGRAAWNIVTSAVNSTAQNFNGTVNVEHGLRYEQAGEFVDVANKLWHSWEQDAFVKDKERGVFVDQSKLQPINHEGKYYKVKGPLNLERSPQGSPLLIQAGSSSAGTDLASRVADVVFTAQTSGDEAKHFNDGLRDKIEQRGRKQTDVSIMPGLFPVIGDTEEEAQANYEELQDLILPEEGLKLLSPYVGDVDLSKYDLKIPFEQVESSDGNGIKSRYELIKKEAMEQNLTLEDVMKKIAGARGHFMVVGTPEQIADTMQYWYEQGAADGFNIMPPLLPTQLELFVDKVVPILQQRGLAQTEYAAGTLKEKFGLEND